MADNVALYGFRIYNGSTEDTGAPLVVRTPVASNYSSATPVGTAGVGFRAGDVVNQLTDGTVQHVVAGDGTTSAVTMRPLGVVVGIDPWFDSTIGQNGALRRTDNLPTGVVYGTNFERQSNLLIVPAENATFEVDVGGAAGAVATTYAAFLALVGTNVNLVYNAVAPKAFPTLDGVLANYGTATRQFHIVGVSPTFMNQDFTGANVKLLVRVNMAQNAPFNTTGI